MVPTPEPAGEEVGIEEISNEEVIVEVQSPPVVVNGSTIQVSSLSLASIRAKREMAESNKALKKEEVHLTEPFTETEMLEQWFKYAQRLENTGKILMATNMQISEPKLRGTTILLEMPNESVSEEFNAAKNDLVGYLRGKLHNHDINIETVINANIDSKKVFNNQDRFNRLNEINPNLDVLRRTFGLEL